MLLLSNINADGTFSVKDTIANKTKHFTKAELNTFNRPIVGVFRDPNTRMICNVRLTNPDNVSVGLQPAIDLIQSQDLKDFVNAIRRVIPEYIFSAPASMSGKYHPACDLGYGGLLRHTLFVTHTLVDICNLESTRQLLSLSQREIDLMAVACIFHDSLKEGWNNEIQKYSWHPKFAADMIRGCVGFLAQNELEFIASCIDSHMGQWNTDRSGNEILPKPANKYQWLVHVADYTSARNITGSLLNNKAYVRSGEEVIVIDAKVPKVEVSDTDIKLLESLVSAFSTGNLVISSSLKTKFGIERPDDACISIWESIIKWKNCSEKQKKYLDLAKSLN